MSTFGPGGRSVGLLLDFEFYIRVLGVPSGPIGLVAHLRCNTFGSQPDSSNMRAVVLQATTRGGLAGHRQRHARRPTPAAAATLCAWLIPSPGTSTRIMYQNLKKCFAAQNDLFRSRSDYTTIPLIRKPLIRKQHPESSSKNQCFN